MTNLYEDERDPYHLYSHPDYVPPINNLVFAIGVIVLGLCCISMILFALGSILQWGATITVEMLQ